MGSKFYTSPLISHSLYCGYVLPASGAEVILSFETLLSREDLMGPERQEVCGLLDIGREQRLNSELLHRYPRVSPHSPVVAR